MPVTNTVATDRIKLIRRNPIHETLTELSKAALELNVHRTDEFRKLIAYILELADGRDRRDPWVQKPGVARPVPRLRVVMEQCFGQFADLQWFKMNKIVNGSGLPLVGQFPRMAASLGRVKGEDFGRFIEAIISENPDAALLRVLHAGGGRISGMGVELFSRLAHTFRRDLYFLVNNPWGESAGCLTFIGSDLRKYCALCRTLRSVCDVLEIEQPIRSAVFDELVNAPVMPEPLKAALTKALGPALAKYTLLGTNDAYQPQSLHDELLAMPLDFAARSIRARRGERKLRDTLLDVYGERCLITGACPADLLELAYIAPYPTGNVHARDNVVLLRSDIHTLWDVNLLSINPENMTVQVAPKLAGSEYARFAGQKVEQQVGGLRMDTDSLTQRWKIFNNSQRSEREERSRATPSVRPSVTPKPAASNASTPVPVRTEVPIRTNTPA